MTKRKRLLPFLCLFTCLLGAVAPAGAVEVTVQIYDPESMQGLAAWCTLTNPAGEYFFPSNEPERLESDTRYFYVWQTFPVELQTDVKYTLRVERGLGWTPAEETFEITQETSTINVGLQSWYRSAKSRWYAGDFSGRFNYFDPSLAMAAHDLSVVCRVVDAEQAKEDLERISTGIFNLPMDRAYSGRDWGFDSYNVLGTSYELVEEETPFKASALQYMEKGKNLGALIDVTDVEDPEIPAAAALGLVDTIRLVGPFPKEATAERNQRRILDRMEKYYELLNAGFRIGISAGSEATEKGLSEWDFLGSSRVYARCWEAFNYGEFMRLAKEGKTWATNGPVLSIGISRRDPGFVFELPRPGVKVSVALGAKSPRPLDRLELIQNGRVIASFPASATEDHIVEDYEFILRQPGWVAARVFEKQANPEDRIRYAHSSPLYFNVQGRPSHQRPVVQNLSTGLAEMIRKTQDSADLDEATREKILSWYNRANEALLSLIR